MMWLYYQCVDFMLHTARLFGVTYRDTNSFMFFILWPLVTAILGVWVVRNQRLIRRVTAPPSDSE